MFRNRAMVVLAGFALFAAGPADGFRNCEVEDSYAWSAATRYTVGELAFDDSSGLASGTETIYNYSNAYPGEAVECHVTYELNGSYVPGVDVFVLEATRSNFSDNCPPALLRVEYPAQVSHNFQIEHAADGSALIHSAENGDFLASGSWQAGKAFYKTGEQCSIF